MRADKTAKARYQSLSLYREPFLRRARDFAMLTIPSLLPPLGHHFTADLPETYTGFGARCVVALASRLTVTFLPPQEVSFRLSVAPEVLLQSGAASVPDHIALGLAKAEDTIQRETERASWRATTELEMQHLIVTGNILEQSLPDNTLKAYRLDQYVVVRDPQGRVVEIVVEEMLTRESMPEKLRSMLEGVDTLGENLDTGGSVPVPLYTWAKWNPDKNEWNVHQEISDKVVPGSKGRYGISPFRALRWCPVLGEAYGRSKVEDHRGDLQSVEGFAKALRDGAAMASRNLLTVRPGGSGGRSLRRNLAEAPNGEVLSADPDDIGAVEFKNTNGMQFTAQVQDSLKQEIGAAFLLNSAMRRDAERVTAYELSKMIEEIESVLGGVYTTISKDMQAPRMQRLILQMQRNRQLPPWPQGMVEPTILTGLDALSRAKDVEKSNMALNAIQVLSPEERMYVKMGTVLGKMFSGMGFVDAVRTDEEVQQIMAQQMQAAAATNVAENVATTAGEAAVQPS